MADDIASPCVLPKVLKATLRVHGRLPHTSVLILVLFILVPASIQATVSTPALILGPASNNKSSSWLHLSNTHQAIQPAVKNSISDYTSDELFDSIKSHSNTIPADPEVGPHHSHHADDNSEPFTTNVHEPKGVSHHHGHHHGRNNAHQFIRKLKSRSGLKHKRTSKTVEDNDSLDASRGLQDNPPEIKTESPPSSPDDLSPVYRDCTVYAHGVLVGVRRHGQQWSDGDDECAICACNDGEKRCYYHYCNEPNVDFITPPSAETPTTDIRDNNKEIKPDRTLPEQTYDLVDNSIDSGDVPGDGTYIDQSVSNQQENSNGDIENSWEYHESSGMHPWPFEDDEDMDYSYSHVDHKDDHDSSKIELNLNVDDDIHPNHVVYMGDYEQFFEKPSPTDLSDSKTSHSERLKNKKIELHHTSESFQSNSDCDKDCSKMCPHGYKLTSNGSGCPSCKCLKCNPVADCTDCPAGYTTDVHDCRVCSCHPSWDIAVHAKEPSFFEDPINYHITSHGSPDQHHRKTHHHKAPPLTASSNGNPHNHFQDNAFNILKADELSILRDDDTHTESRLGNLLDDVTTVTPIEDFYDVDYSVRTNEDLTTTVGWEEIEKKTGGQEDDEEEKDCNHTVPHGCPDPAGVVHRVGSSWRKDVCTVCRCLSRGYAECTVTKCPVPLGSTVGCSPPLPGECCPRCDAKTDVSPAPVPVPPSLSLDDRSSLRREQVSSSSSVATGDAVKQPVKDDITSICLMVIGLAGSSVLVAGLAIHYWRHCRHSDKYDINGSCSPEETQKLSHVKVSSCSDDASSVTEPLKSSKCV